MPNSYYPDGERPFSAWMQNLVTVAKANTASLPLTAAQITALDNVQKAYQASLDAIAAAKQQAKSATTAKNVAYKAALALVRPANLQIQGATAVSDTLKKQMGLTVRKKPAKLAPVTPLKLVATGYADGTNELEWKSGGNKYGATYCIEYSLDASNTWTQLDTSTRVRYTHMGTTPGMPISYRVRTRRNGAYSGYSNEAAIYISQVTPIRIVEGGQKAA